MIIDCDSCEVRGLACGDCVVTALLGAPPAGVDLDEGERAAIDALAGSGLVPPLRLVLALDEVPSAASREGFENYDRDATHGPLAKNAAPSSGPGDARSVAAG